MTKFFCFFLFTKRRLPYSTATFDLSRTVTLRGTVQTFEWTNPHVWVWVSVPGAGGDVVVWGVESGPPVILHRSGFSRYSFRAGDRLTMIIHPLKSGQHGGQFMIATFADGHVLRTPDPAAFATPEVVGPK